MLPKYNRDKFSVMFCSFLFDNAAWNIQLSSASVHPPHDGLFFSIFLPYNPQLTNTSSAPTSPAYYSTTTILQDEHLADDVSEAKVELEVFPSQGLLKKANVAIEELEKFYTTVEKEWGKPSQRTIGHIRSSPAIVLNVVPGVHRGPRKFAKAFKGEFLDLGTEIPLDQFTLKCAPALTPHFKYPSNRLLPLWDMITEELMRSPDMLDHENEACLLLIKNGDATDVTIGRLIGISLLFASTPQELIEWAIYNYDYKYGVFSAIGDLGSIIVDGFGRMVGLHTGGSGKTEASDVTYATPFWWL